MLWQEFPHGKKDVDVGRKVVEVGLKNEKVAKPPTPWRHCLCAYCQSVPMRRDETYHALFAKFVDFRTSLVAKAKDMEQSSEEKSANCSEYLGTHLRMTEPKVLMR